MAESDILGYFLKATSSVYGNFDHLTQDEAAAWTPPDNPGAGGHRGRYLWTDAFGVVNFITLFQKTSSPKYLILAKILVRTVHEVLGRTRDGSARLSGATDESPLAGGLRIGKISATGSDGDGQYHHYLTLWMFALNRLSIATGDPTYNDLAIQLAKAIHPRFVLKSSAGGPRMVWKISTDMDRVLVPSEGHLDAATGYVVYRLLEQLAKSHGRSETSLQQEIEDYRNLMHRKGNLMPSNDFLDLGMGLWMCHFVQGEPWATKFGDEQLRVAREMFHHDGGFLQRDASRRLAFREFGACLGILCFSSDDYLMSETTGLVKFWQDRLEEHGGEDLRPISQVMYAASLIPGAFQKEFFDNE